MKKNNVLDLVFTDNEQWKENFGYENPLGKSDHSVLKFNYICEIER